MAEDREPEDDFQEMLRRLLSGDAGSIDPAEFQRMTGMAFDPAMLQGAMQQMQGMFAAAQASGGGIPWDQATRQALHIANQDGLSVTSGQKSDLDGALSLANLWLGEATAVPELTQVPRVLTRGQWVEETFPVWQELAEPVATGMTDAMLATIAEQTPDDMREMVQGAGRVMRTIGGSLFATQLGQVIGRLSTETISGGDVGLPLLPAGEAAILPQNFADFGRDLEIGEDQLALYLGVRELAHARLFRHARWLRLQVTSLVSEFARGYVFDTSRFEDIASSFDPSNPESFRSAIESGALLPERTEVQEATLRRLEDVLATIEGWVEVVTADATGRLPRAGAIAETVRRRRAAGGPAEEALGLLVGLELRPRRLREATAMWRAVTDALGVQARDALWDYPDFLPTAADIDDPQALISRMRDRVQDAADDTPVDEIDDAIARILAGEQPEDLAIDGEDEGGNDDAHPEDPRPV